MTNNLETPITALHVKIDDELGGTRWTDWPSVLTYSELVCVAMAQGLLGFTSEPHWRSCARRHLASPSVYLPQQSGYNKRLRAALGLIKRMIRLLFRSSEFWLDDCWIVDSTSVPGRMSRTTLGSGGLGRVPLPREPFPLHPGPAPVTGAHPVWHADPVGAGEPEVRGT